MEKDLFIDLVEATKKAKGLVVTECEDIEALEDALSHMAEGKEFVLRKISEGHPIIFMNLGIADDEDEEQMKYCPLGSITIHSENGKYYHCQAFTGFESDQDRLRYQTEVIALLKGGRAELESVKETHAIAELLFGN